MSDINLHDTYLIVFGRWGSNKVKDGNIEDSIEQK